MTTPVAGETDPGDVRRRLGLPAQASDPATDLDRWLAQLDAAGPPVEPVVLPGPGELPAVLARLGAPDEDIPAVIASIPATTGDPALWWLLERCVTWVRTRLGTHDEPSPEWPDLPAAAGPARRFFFVHAFLAALPVTLDHEQAHGIDPDVSWATLSDLGTKMAMYRRAHGTGGLEKQDWLTLHLRGAIHALGRLQFAVTDLTPALRLPSGAPAVGLGIHIPETGPLHPAAVDASLARAAAFCAAHVETPVGDLAVCTSWLLDPRLAEHLPPTANIVAFQRRFTLTADVHPGDADILEFVTGRPDRALADIPRATTLERAIADHLGAGGHWELRTGWLRLPPP